MALETLRRLRGLREAGTYRLAERTGHLSHIGAVKVVFSRRRNEGKVLALVTDDLGASGQEVVADYLKRWAIELLIKDEKQGSPNAVHGVWGPQQSGLGDYRVLRYRAVVRRRPPNATYRVWSLHLHLVDLAHVCLTHLALSEPGAQGHKNNQKVLRLPPISRLVTRMRQILWQEAVEDVVRHSHEKSVIRRLEKPWAA